MATFIKPGYWLTTTYKPKYWLNIDDLVSTVVTPIVDTAITESPTVSALTYPVENSYLDQASMLADQGSQTTSYFQYQIDTDTYYEKLITSTGAIGDYRELTADEVTTIVLQGNSKKPVNKIYANATAMYADQKKQVTGFLYRTSDNDSHFEYLGTRNGNASDYISLGSVPTLQEVVDADGYAQWDGGNIYLDFTYSDVAASSYFESYISGGGITSDLYQTQTGILAAIESTTNGGSLLIDNLTGFELLRVDYVNSWETRIRAAAPIANTILNFPAKAAGTYTLATTADIGAIGLQAVTDVGNTTTLNIAALSFNDLRLFAQTGVDVDNIGIGTNALSSNTGTNAVAIGTSALGNNAQQNCVAIGWTAMNANTGIETVGIGYNAGRNNSGIYSSFVGGSAGYNNTGSSASGFGRHSLKENTGNNISALGYSSGNENTGGQSSFIGIAAGLYNKGNSVSVVGMAAAQYNIGDESVGIGYFALANNEGDNNTIIGSRAAQIFANDTGNAQDVADASTDVDTVLNRITITAHGFGLTGEFLSLRYTTTGISIGNIASNNIYFFEIIDGNTIEFVDISINGVGTDTHTFTPQFVYNNVTVLGANAEPTASNQVMLGDTGVTEVSAVNANYVGSRFNGAYLGIINNDTVFLGDNAMASNTGSWSTAFGADALTTNSANFITAVGRRALQNNGAATSNTGVGNEALRNNTGNNNTGVGSYSLLNNTGDGNTSVGISLQNNSGDNNVGVGQSCLQYNTAINNSGIGNYSGQYNKGINSVFIGQQAGALNIGDTCVHIGNSSGFSSIGFDNTSIGANSNETFKEDVASAKNVANAATDVDFANNRVTITAHGFGATSSYINLKYTTTGTVIGGLANLNIYQVFIVDANTIEFRGGISLLSVGTNTHTFTPQFIYENITVLGANAEPTKSNQVTLGDTTVTEVSAVNANYVGSTFNDLSLFAQIGIDVDNIGIGTSALFTNTGTDVIGIGTGTLFFNSGSEAIGIGKNALQSNTGNFGCIGIGREAMQNNTGQQTISVGGFSGKLNTGINSVFMGSSSGQYNKGNNSVLVGFSAGQENKGDNVIGIGFDSTKFNSGNSSTSIGNTSSVYNQGDNNTSIGSNNNTTFKDDVANLKNVAVAATDIDTGLDRITITTHGFGSIGEFVNLRYTTTGTPIGGLVSGNVYYFEIIDANTLEATTVNIFSVGTDTHTFTPQFVYSNVTVLGANAEPTKSNQVVLGDSTTVTEIYSPLANYVGATFNDLKLFAQIGVDANNIGIGNNALNGNTGTTGVIGIGDDTLINNTRSAIVAIGSDAGSNNTGSSSVMIGQQAGESNTGTYLTAIGRQAGRTNTGSNLTAIGGAAGGTGNSGNNNTFIGYISSISGDKTKSDNTFVGALSGRYNQGQDNTLMGYQAGQVNGGSYVSGFGRYSLLRNNGNDNTAIGWSSLYYGGGGINNTALGYNTMGDFINDTPNAKNVATAATDVDFANNQITITGHGFGSIGTFVNLRYNTTGTPISGLTDNDIYLFEIISANIIEIITPNITTTGTDTHTFTPNTVYSNSTAVGANASFTASNQVILGDSSVTEVYTDGHIKTHKEVTNDTTTAYELVLGDRNSIVTLDNGAATTLTIPANASVAFPIGTEVVLINKGAGTVTVGITTDTLNQNVGGLTLAQYDKRTLIKITATSWILGY